MGSKLKKKMKWKIRISISKDLFFYCYILLLWIIWQYTVKCFDQLFDRSNLGRFKSGVIMVSKETRVPEFGNCSIKLFPCSSDWVRSGSKGTRPAQYLITQLKNQINKWMKKWIWLFLYLQLFICCLTQKRYFIFFCE